MNASSLATRLTNSFEKERYVSQGNEPVVLSDIYESQCNIAIWRRTLSSEIQSNVSEFLKEHSGLQASMTLSPENAASVIHEALGGSELTRLISEDIAELVDIFCCLFELERVGLRLTALDKAMCPKFHVDKVPGRLVTTYQGTATEWLEHSKVNRSKLGHGSEGKLDSESGLYANASDIQRLDAGDVALLKGERWEGNEGAGLVHRSPALGDGERRLLLTLDFN